MYSVAGIVINSPKEIPKIIQLLAWRFRADLWTYSNGLLIVMICTGIVLWTSNPLASTAIQDIAQFTRGHLPYHVMAGAMIVIGVLALFRRWQPHELFILYLPYFFFVFIIGWLTFFDPTPQRPLARLWSWLAPVVLNHFYMMERTHDTRADLD